MAMSETFFKGVEGIEIIENKSVSTMEDLIYSKEFISKVKKAEAEIKKGNTIRLNPNDIWGSIL